MKGPEHFGLVGRNLNDAETFLLEVFLHEPRYPRARLSKIIGQLCEFTFLKLKRMARTLHELATVTLARIVLTRRVHISYMRYRLCRLEVTMSSILPRFVFLR